ncbi:MAG: PQQ-binding-like beta-propeller repeat protein, partial [Planctomycetota bacterium]
MKRRMTWLICALLLVAMGGFATETENLNLQVPRAPKPVQVDGQADEWPLVAGAFLCSDVENLRDKVACWFHAMHDGENLYLLARWIDHTPMNNPGSIAGDHGFAGDSLQVRVITRPDQGDEERTTHITAWRDRDGKDVIDLAWGKRFNEGGMKDAKTAGARQAFRADADGKGYVQEIAIPWSLLAKEGIVPQTGERIVITVEPNFYIESGFRMSVKGIFRPGETPDRVFTFSANRCWGYGTLAADLPAEPRALRLADSRELPVSMEDGAPRVDWAPLFAREERPGVVALPFTMPEDGYVSLNIVDGDGRVVRQLLTCDYFGKGEHEVQWDGLTTPHARKPGEVVAAGDYAWKAICHTGIGLRMVGWANNAGSAPFDVPGGNWGGDHGNPVAVASEGKRIVLGWSGSEAGKAVVCTDPNGKVLWRHKRGGFGMARLVAIDNEVVYVNDMQQGDNVIYRLDAKSGRFSPWEGRGDDALLPLKDLLEPYAPAMDEADLPKDKKGNPKPRKYVATGLDVANGTLALAYGEGDRVLLLDATTGAKTAEAEVASPGDLEFGPDGSLYVVSEEAGIVRLAKDLASHETVLDGLAAAKGIALDKDGNLYVGFGDPDHRIHVYSPAGEELRTIGKPGGRALLGPWEAEGLRFLAGLSVDERGKLWVAENDAAPRRFSRWNAADGTLEQEFFGPTHYGAGGGAISPRDPLTMVGNGCEWTLDAGTGRASCAGVIHRGRWHNARFGEGANGRLYLAIGGGWHGHHPVYLYERKAAGDWALRSRLSPLMKEEGEGRRKREVLGGMIVWADRNGDQEEQADEIATYEKDLGGWIDGWYMPMAQDLSFCGSLFRIAPTGFTDCGAPIYNLDQATPLPHPEDWNRRGGMGAQRGHGSEDGDLVIYNGHYGAGHSDFVCYDIASGKEVWRYPNTFVGVHGGHRAPPPEVGLIRAAYDIVGTAKLPEPIGHIFVIPTDKGEWHILTGEGFYLTRLFQGNPMKINWPSPAAPGAVMDAVPPGMGAEDFGGSIIHTDDGALHVQAGKTAFINMKVVGLDTVQALGQGDAPSGEIGVRRL